MKKDKILACDIKSLPKDYLITLCEVSLSTFTPLTHDLNDPGHTLYGSAGMLYDTVSNISDIRDKIKTPEQLEQLLKNIKGHTELILKSSVTIFEFIRGYFDPLAFRHQFPDKSVVARKLLYACPAEQIKKIEKEFPGINITIGSSTKKSLVIVYPKNILYWIFRELIRNALQANNKALIQVNWYVKNEHFQLNVHDNCRRITESFRGSVTIEVLEKSNIIPIRTTSGLSLIENIVRTSKGRFLISKSTRLGGNLISISIPIPLYYLQDKECYVQKK